MANTAHIKIDKHDGAWRVLLDGRDVAHQLTQDGLNVWFEMGSPFDSSPRVSLTFADVDLEADLPEAVVDALRKKEG